MMFCNKQYVFNLIIINCENCLALVSHLRNERDFLFVCFFVLSVMNLKPKKCLVPGEAFLPYAPLSSWDCCVLKRVEISNRAVSEADLDPRMNLIDQVLNGSHKLLFTSL